jgi:cation transport ATPase
MAPAPKRISGAAFLNPWNLSLYQRVAAMINERTTRRALIMIALAGLSIGLAAAFAGHNGLARWIWAAGTIPVVAGLAISIVRDVLAGRMGVDAVAFVSMAAALALGQTLAGVVVAIMYAGGNVLEDFAVGRAERDLKSLVDRCCRKPCSTILPTNVS